MMPEQQNPVPEAAALAPVERPAYSWYHKFSAVVLVTCCLLMGLFLLIFPWTEFWDDNYFSVLIPSWRPLWDNMYVRGAISGLGLVNLYISFVEVFRLRRFAKY